MTRRNLSKILAAIIFCAALVPSVSFAQQNVVIPPASDYSAPPQSNSSVPNSVIFNSDSNSSNSGGFNGAPASSAYTLTPSSSDGNTATTPVSGINGYTPPSASNSGSLFPNPFSGGSTICSFLVAVLDLITETGAILGALALLGVGFYYIYARGKPEKLTTAHHAFWWTILGITMLLGASVLAHILITTVNAVLTAGGGNFANQSALTCSS